MKKLKIAILFATALFLTIGSVLAQNTETRTVNVSGSFDAINIAGTQTVHFEIGPGGDPLTVIGHPTDLDNMEIKIANGTLNIGYRKGYRIRGNRSVQVYIKNPTLKGGSVSGTGTLNIAGKLDEGKNSFSVSGTGRVLVEKVDCKDLSCSVSGTGRIECPSVAADDISAKVSGTGKINLTDVDAVNVTVRTSGTGRITMSGTCETLQASTSGTGSIHVEELHAVDVEARSSGTGSVYCYSTGKFNGSVSGVGKVYVSGNPETVKFSGKPGKLVQR